MAFDLVGDIALKFQKSGPGSLIKPTYAYTAAHLTMLNAQLRHVEDLILDPGLSSFAISMPPFVESNPGTLLWAFSDNAVDLAFDAASHVISGIRIITVIAPIDTLYVTTTQQTALHLELVGGSNASLAINTTPL